IEATGLEGIREISLQGGYYNIPEPAAETHWGTVSYYFYEGRDRAPGKEAVEQELGRYIEEQLPTCTKNFSSFPDYRILQQEPSVQAMITLSSVRLQVTYPLTILQEESRKEMEQFAAEIPSNVEKLHRASQEATAFQMQNPQEICLSCLATLAEQEKLWMDLELWHENAIVISIVDMATEEEEPLTWLFANKYAMGEGEEQLERELVILDVPDQTAEVGKLFQLTIQATEPNVLYRDFTELFEIHPLTGSIAFTPTPAQKGLHLIWIEAEKEDGEKAFITFSLTVKE
ncbi:hypothetical protein HYS48_05205, partial [Candidatus Woesearchaeota archaeon]|nr:hypothetical protein [Candidatus Woesearchaeota archaeon]